MSKYFATIFWCMLLVAGVLSIMLTKEIENRFENIEGNLDKINVMLEDMSNE